MTTRHTSLLLAAGAMLGFGAAMTVLAPWATASANGPKPAETAAPSGVYVPNDFRVGARVIPPMQQEETEIRDQVGSWVMCYMDVQVIDPANPAPPDQPPPMKRMPCWFDLSASSQPPYTLVTPAPKEDAPRLDLKRYPPIFQVGAKFGRIDLLPMIGAMEILELGKDGWLRVVVNMPDFSGENPPTPRVGWINLGDQHLATWQFPAMKVPEKPAEKK